MNGMDAAGGIVVQGLVGAGSAGGCSAGGDAWQLVLHLAGWRTEGGELCRGELRVELPVSKSELSALMKTFGSWAHVRIAGSLEERSGGCPMLVARNVVLAEPDAELEALAEELRKPVMVQDGLFGELVLDRALGSYDGQAKWQGEDVELSLNPERIESVQPVLDQARALWGREGEWGPRLFPFAAEKLLELKNDSWLDEEEDEEPLTAEAFVDRLSIESVNVSEDGSFEFYIDDGDLFWGHVIIVSGNLEEGFTGADIAG